MHKSKLQLPTWSMLPQPFKIPTATSNALFLIASGYFHVGPINNKVSRGLSSKLKWWDLKPLRGTARCISSACGSRVQKASEGAQCKHEAQPLPAQPLAQPQNSLLCTSSITHTYQWVSPIRMESKWKLFVHTWNDAQKCFSNDQITCKRLHKNDYQSCGCRVHFDSMSTCKFRWKNKETLIKSSIKFSTHFIIWHLGSPRLSLPFLFLLCISLTYLIVFSLIKKNWTES